MNSIEILVCIIAQSEYDFIASDFSALHNLILDEHVYSVSFRKRIRFTEKGGCWQRK